MKILILGGSGMLGHKLYHKLKESYDVKVTIRGSYKDIAQYNIFQPEDVREDVDANYFDSIIRTLASFKPDVVINCIGLVKQIPISGDPLSAISINTLLPHRLSLIAASSKIRLIHISTDCVFSGKKGNYVESDISDAEDLYGRTKYLGEVNYGPHTLTIRTSIVGLEYHSANGLISWFLNQTKSIEGYKKAIFSGFTTIELAKIFSEFIIPNDTLSGIYHLSTNPISKFELLHLVKEVFKKDIEIISNEKYICDRSLDSTRFKKVTGYVAPEWKTLISNLK